MRKALFVPVLILCLLSPVVAWARAQPAQAETPSPKQTPPLEETVLVKETASAEETASAGETPAPIKEHKVRDTVNLLVVGEDARQGAARGRSDAIVLAVIDEKEGTVKLVSFMRDLYVKIPGHGQNRLNSAYAKGGGELLAQTLSENFGVRVDKHIAFTFEGAAKVVNAAGGLSVELDDREARDMNAKYGKEAYSAGPATLRGRKAVYYLRIRKNSGGDFLRTQRHRQALGYLLKNAPEWSPAEYARFALELGEEFTTDIAPEEISEWAARALALRDAQVEGMRVPQDGMYSNAVKGGMAVLSPNLEKNRAAIEEFLGS